MLLVVGITICTVSCLLYGPSQFLVPLFDTSPQLIAIAGMTCGIGQAFIFIPTLTEYMSYMKEVDATGSEDKLTDLSSGLFTIGFSIGELMGPLMGGMLKQAFGFQTAANLLAGLMIAVSCYHAKVALSLHKRAVAL